MGCASSNPLIQGSKQFAETTKDSVAEAVSKGEHVLHDVGEAAREGIEHLKDAVGATAATAQSSISNVVEKIGDTISSEKDKHQENVDNAETIATPQKAKIVEESSDSAEVVSESATVLAPEVEYQNDCMESSIGDADKLGETAATNAKENLSDVLRLEDIEQTTLDTIESNYKDMKKKAEDLVNKLTSTPSSEPAEEAKEESAPTFWEAAADAILHKKVPPLPRQRFSFEDEEDDDGHLSRHEADPSDIEESTQQRPLRFTPAGIEQRSLPFEGELFEKESMHPPEIIISSENLSIKSYKSEI